MNQQNQNVAAIMLQGGPMNQQNQNVAAIMLQAKSVGLSVILTCLFGGLGLFYVSIMGGVVMTLFEMVAWIVTVLTFGLGFVFVFLVHVAALIWAIVGAQNYNKRLLATGRA